DLDGNLIKEASPQGTTTYSYSDENRLIAVNSPQGSWNYGYDGLGNRVGMTQNGIITRYVVDPTGMPKVVGEYDQGGGLLAHYDNSFSAIARDDAANTSAFYLFDGMGNVQQMASASGVIQN